MEQQGHARSQSVLVRPRRTLGAGAQRTRRTLDLHLARPETLDLREPCHRILGVPRTVRTSGRRRPRQHEMGDVRGFGNLHARIVRRPGVPSRVGQTPLHVGQHLRGPDLHEHSGRRRTAHPDRLGPHFAPRDAFQGHDDDAHGTDAAYDQGRRAAGQHAGRRTRPAVPPAGRMEGA